MIAPGNGLGVAGRLWDRRSDGGYDRHEVYVNTPAHEAIMEWCRFHGLDPGSIPAGSVIQRDEAAHVIAYTVFVRDEQGRLLMDGSVPRTEDRTERGEAGPLPFPAEITGGAA